MPTEIRQDGFDVVINTRDEHPPPHVHVYKAEGEVVIFLGSRRTGPSIDESYDMPKKEAKAALKIVEKNQKHLLKRWREIWRLRHV